MKKKNWIFLLFLFIPCFGLTQIISDSLLVGFYNKTIECYFASINKLDDDVLLINSDIQSTFLITTIQSLPIKYFSNNVSEKKMCPKPIKKNTCRKLFYIKHKVIGLDTVDVDINKVNICFDKKKNMEIIAECGGTFGYIPTCRFIYDRSTSLWTFLTSNEIIEKKINTYRIE